MREFISTSTILRKVKGSMKVAFLEPLFRCCATPSPRPHTHPKKALKVPKTVSTNSGSGQIWSDRRLALDRMFPNGKTLFLVFCHFWQLQQPSSSGVRLLCTYHDDHIFLLCRIELILKFVSCIINDVICAFRVDMLTSRVSLSFQHTVYVSQGVLRCCLVLAPRRNTQMLFWHCNTGNINAKWNIARKWRGICQYWKPVWMHYIGAHSALMIAQAIKKSNALPSTKYSLGGSTLVNELDVLIVMQLSFAINLCIFAQCQSECAVSAQTEVGLLYESIFARSQILRPSHEEFCIN